MTHKKDIELKDKLNRTTKNKHKSVIDFNHIDEKLSKDDLDKFTKLYRFYHRLYTCYKWKYGRLKRLYLSLKISSIALVVIGGIAGGVTVNPIILGTISGPGVLIQTYLTTRSISKKIEMCRFAYTSYKKVLAQIRSYLRGLDYDETIFLSDVKVIEDTVIDLCPPIDELSVKYNNTYR